jgi:hypothetical protein
MTARRRDEAVSTVVSAVLVFSLIVVVLSVYASTIVPDQVANAEAGHMRRVASSLGDVAGQIEGTINLHRDGEFASQIELGTTTMPGLAVFRSSGSLSVQQDSYLATFVCSTPRLLARGGQAAAGSTYVAMGGPAFTFSSLVALNLKVTAYDFNTASGTKSATVQVLRQGTPVASVRLTLADSTNSIRLTTLDGAGATVFTQVLLSNVPLVDSFVVDALAGAYGFKGLLGDAVGPFTMQTSTTTSAIAAYAVYQDDQGIVSSQGQGRDLVAQFQRALRPSMVVYRSDNSRFIEQTYALQGGALVLDQSNGQVLSLQPFDVAKAPGKQQLHLALVNLTGVGYVTGSQHATLSVAVRDTTTSVLQCTNPSALVQSPYPDAWLGAWREALVRQGLDPAQAARSGDVVEARLLGAWTVVLEEARVSVRLT